MTRWAVKVKRYGGGESVISIHDEENVARSVAKARNRDYQTDSYYVEKWGEAL